MGFWGFGVLGFWMQQHLIMTHLQTLTMVHVLLLFLGVLIQLP